MTVGKQDFRLEGHSDYVRSAAVSPSSGDTWATAGYDHICKLWDVRSQECVMNLDHGAPIEDVAFFPSGRPGTTASAGLQAAALAAGLLNRVKGTAWQLWSEAAAFTDALLTADDAGWLRPTSASLRSASLSCTS